MENRRLGISSYNRWTWHSLRGEARWPSVYQSVELQAAEEHDFKWHSRAGWNRENSCFQNECDSGEHWNLQGNLICNLSRVPTVHFSPWQGYLVPDIPTNLLSDLLVKVELKCQGSEGMVIANIIFMCTECKITSRRIELQPLARFHLLALYSYWFIIISHLVDQIGQSFTYPDLHM